MQGLLPENFLENGWWQHQTDQQSPGRPQVLQGAEANPWTAHEEIKELLLEVDL